jgi:hypothetical protein
LDAKEEEELHDVIKSTGLIASFLSL